MSKQNAAKNKAASLHVNFTEHELVSKHALPGSPQPFVKFITAADIDEVLAILPMSKIHLASMLRYGDDPWTPIEKARAKLEELKARFAG